MEHIKLTKSVLSVDEVSSLVSDASCGAIALFVGTTRDSFEGLQVKQLQYEAYEEMAEKEMKKLCSEARSKWQLTNIAIHHRLGIVGIKEASVIVAVSSVHRREALDAVSFLIDALKASVPIWKKEEYLEGESVWKKNMECKWTKSKNTSNGSTKPALNDDTQTRDDSIADCNAEIMNDKKRKLDCNSKSVDLESPSETQCELINPVAVQITCSKEELLRRIHAFQQQKREELNALNVQEFCFQQGIGKEMESCARAKAVICRNKGSNSHLKITKVVNPWGPQTSGIDPGTKLPTPLKQEKPEGEVSECSPKNNCERKTIKSTLPIGVDDRLCNIESHLQLQPNRPIPPSIYGRLKACEDRIMFLESLSPEYFDKHGPKLKTNIYTDDNTTKATDDDMTLSEVNRQIFELRKRLKHKQLYS